MKISVIIPTFNEEEVIGQCLTSLSKQTYKDFEVIVVDDGSTDSTKEKIESLNNLFLEKKIIVLNQKHKGPGAARNLGVLHSKGQILVFVDSDMTFDKKFLKMLTFPIVSGKSKGTFSKDEIVSNWDNIWSRCWSINEGWVKKRRHPKNYPDTQAVFRSILKSEFVKAGGFTPGGYDDDWSLSKKLGYKATLAKNAFFYHKNPQTLREVFKHAQWVAKRKYKLGFLGYIVALFRSSLPISIIVGFYKSLISIEIRFIIFKIVYDFGVFVGLLNYLFTKNASK